MSDEPNELVNLQGLCVSAWDARKLMLDQQAWGNGYVKVDAEGVMRRVPPSQVLDETRAAWLDREPYASLMLADYATEVLTQARARGESLDGYRLVLTAERVAERVADA